MDGRASERTDEPTNERRNECREREREREWKKVRHLRFRTRSANRMIYGIETFAVSSGGVIIGFVSVRAREPTSAIRAERAKINGN